MKLGCVIMAAGESRRFGENKLLRCFDGVPLYIRALNAVPEHVFTQVCVVSAFAPVLASGNNESRISANVPLAELFGYATTIRSLSRGRATYSMEPAHFDRVPKAIQDKLVEKR